MIELLKYSLTDLKNLFSTTSIKSKINYNIVEKDFWVSIILEYLFKNSKFKSELIFKGGTSLSKCYNIIDRFSEDVDLILKYSAIGLEENLEKLSNTQQDLLNKKIIEKTRSFLKTEFLDYLNDDFKKISNHKFEFKYQEEEPDSIMFYYPTESNDNYILPYVKLEVGVLAGNNPVESKEVNSIVSHYNEKLTTNEYSIPVISIIRTFWEKVTIIHAECKRDYNKYHRRYSRHFYDVYKILKLIDWNTLIEASNLIAEVVNFKKKYYRQNSAKYEDVINHKLDITLCEDALIYFKHDYKLMENMLIGSFPSFSEINKELISFQKFYND